jgi:ceramide glucosyltransferase
MLYLAGFLCLAFCSFWTAQILFVHFHQKKTGVFIKSTVLDAKSHVSIIHPIKDVDFELEKNLASWMNQDFTGKVQHIFSFQNPEDPAIQAVRTFMREYPGMDWTITVNPLIPGFSGKGSNMAHAIKLSKYGILLFTDSDVRVQSDYVTRMTRPLADPKVGVTTSSQLVSGGRKFWTRFFSFTQNSEANFYWSFLATLGMRLGITGAAFALTKKVLEGIGGLEPYAVTLHEDMHMGNAIIDKGYKVVVGPYVACHLDEVPLDRCLNYAKRIAGALRNNVLSDLPIYLLMLIGYWVVLIIGLIAGNPVVTVLGLFMIFLRMLQGIFMKLVTGNRFHAYDIIMGPFFDLFGLFYILYSFNNHKVVWRDVQYDLGTRGHIDKAG